MCLTEPLLRSTAGLDKKKKTNTFIITPENLKDVVWQMTSTLVDDTL